jgi:hypothetical protein
MHDYTQVHTPHLPRFSTPYHAYTHGYHMDITVVSQGIAGY